MTKRGIDWRGIDGAGYYYGFYREGQTQYQIDIAVPGKGFEAHKGPDHKVYVEGAKIGSMPTLKGAAALADLWFTEGRHRPRQSAQPAHGQTQSASTLPNGRAKLNQPQTSGRETVESETRDRRSIREVLEAYLSKKPPMGRSR